MYDKIFNFDDVLIEHNYEKDSKNHWELLNFKSFIGLPYSRFAVGFCRSVKHYVYAALMPASSKPVSTQDCDDFNGMPAYGTIERVLHYFLPTSNWDFTKQKPPPCSKTLTVGDVTCKSSFFDGATVGSIPGIRELVEEAKKEILPDNMLERLQQATSKEETVNILSQFELLDQFHFGKDGLFYKKLVKINESTMPQARRITMSVTLGPEELEPRTNSRKLELFGYGAAHRPRSDWRCKPITPALHALGEKLWKIFWPYLSPASQQCPPTAVQVMILIGNFKGKVSAHKDNGMLGDNRQTGTTNVELNSHLFGTDVLTLTIGDLMKFGLLKPKKGYSYTSAKEHFEWNPSSTMDVDDLCVYILNALDDEMFFHASKFEGECKGKVRVALTFRWLARRLPYLCGGLERDGPRHEAMASEAEWDKLIANSKKKGNMKHLWVEALELSS